MQGALFGAAHAYQNLLGIAITGTLGILMGLLVLASGRNLWAVIVGHGLFDAVVLFCSIVKGRRREAGNLAGSRLRPQTSRQNCPRHVLPS
jgi:membrane protease YdiL (CAAX protease family)